MTSVPEVLPWLQHEGGAYVRAVDLSRGEAAVGVVHSVSIDPTEQRIVVAGGWWLTFWNAKHRTSTSRCRRQQLGAINFYPQTLHVAQWDPLGYQLAFGGDVGYIGLVRKIEGPGCAVIDRETVSLKENWQEVVRLLGHQSDVVNLAWSSPTTLASASLDTTVIIWNVQSQERLCKLEGHKSFAKAVAWSPCGSFLATLADDRQLIVWNFPEGIIETSVTKPFEQSPVSSCTASMKMDWSPNGKKLVAVHATKSNDIQLCVVISQQDWSYEYRGIEGHGSIYLAQFNPYLFSKDARGYYYWVSAGTMGVISLWRELETGTGHLSDKEPVATTTVPGTIRDLCWCPDGYTLLIAILEGIVLQWKFSSDLLGNKTACDAVAGAVVEAPVPSGVPAGDVRTVIKPRVRRRPPGKRIAPMRMEQAEREIAEMSPSKRRRLKSLNPVDAAAPIKNAFWVAIKGRRGHLYRLTVHNQLQTENSASVLVYQELGRVIWRLKIDSTVACAAANVTFLCLITAQWHLMVFRLKSASLLLPAQSLGGSVQSMSCSTASTLVIVLSDESVSVWDLNALTEKERISYASLSLPRREREGYPVEASCTTEGVIQLHFISTTFMYCPQSQRWTETDHDTSLTTEQGNLSPQEQELQEGDVIFECFTEVEASLYAAQRAQDLKALHLAVLELMYRIFSNYTPEHYWRGRKLLYLTESVLSSPTLFPNYFQQLYLKELFSEFAHLSDGVLKRDVLLLMFSTDGI